MATPLETTGFVLTTISLIFAVVLIIPFYSLTCTCCCKSQSSKCYIRMNVLSITVFTLYIITALIYWFYYLSEMTNTKNPNYGILLMGAGPYLLTIHLQLLLFVWRLQTLNDLKLSAIFAYSNKIVYSLYVSIIICCIVGVLPWITDFVIVFSLFIIVFISLYSVLVSLYLKQIVRLLHYKINNNSNNVSNVEMKSIKTATGGKESTESNINNNRVTGATGGDIAQLSIDLSIQYCVSLLIGFITTSIIFVIYFIVIAFYSQSDDTFKNREYIPFNEMWVTVDCAINACVIYCLYPFSRGFYNKICCVADKFCRKRVLLRMAQKDTTLHESNGNGNGKGKDSMDGKNAQQLKNLLLSSSYGSVDAQ